MSPYAATPWTSNASYGITRKRCVVEADGAIETVRDVEALTGPMVAYGPPLTLSWSR